MQTRTNSQKNIIPEPLRGSQEIPKQINMNGKRSVYTKSMNPLVQIPEHSSAFNPDYYQSSNRQVQ